VEDAVVGLAVVPPRVIVSVTSKLLPVTRIPVPPFKEIRSGEPSVNAPENASTVVITAGPFTVKSGPSLGPNSSRMATAYRPAAFAGVVNISCVSLRYVVATSTESNCRTSVSRKFEPVTVTSVPPASTPTGGE